MLAKKAATENGGHTTPPIGIGLIWGKPSGQALTPSRWLRCHIPDRPRGDVASPVSTFELFAEVLANFDHGEVEYWYDCWSMLLVGDNTSHKLLWRCYRNNSK